MRAFITGLDGFVGPYLANELISRKYDVMGTYLSSKSKDVPDQVEQIQIDIVDYENLYSAIKGFKPDVIFHLAAISDVGFSFKNPDKTRKINVDGTKNILESAYNTESKPKVIIIGSSMEYGIPQSLPIKEEHPLNPNNPYGESKVEAEKIAKNYWEKGLFVICTRSFNHTGPGQSDKFVSSNFGKQIAYIEKGKSESLIEVGDLSAKRDFTDVRDVVKAYVDLAQKGKSGEIYNVCSGNAVSIEEILNTLLSMTEIKVKINKVDDKIRPTEIPIFLGDNTKIGDDTGWYPKIEFKDTLKDLLNYWREKV